MLSILCCFMHLFQSGILSGSEYKYTPVQGGWLGIVPPLQPWFWPAVLASLLTDYQSPSNMYQSYKVMEDGWLGCASLQLLAGWSICALLPIQIQITD